MGKTEAVDIRNIKKLPVSNEIRDALMKVLGMQVPDEQTNIEVREVEQATISIPKGWSIPKAIEWLGKKHEDEESDVQVRYTVKGFPMDAAYAFHKVLADHCGFTEFSGVGFGWFTMPPTFVSFESGHGKTTELPWGTIRPLGLEGHLALSFTMSATAIPELVVTGVVKKREQDKVKELVEATRRRLKADSLYRGKAIKLNFDWRRTGVGYNVGSDAPKFMDLSGSSRESLVLNPGTQFELESSVLSRIEDPDGCRELGMGFKHGVLATGDFGVGKTLMAKVIASIASEHGVTFIYLDDARDVAAGLRTAEMIGGRCVVLVEDVDSVTKDGRTIELNELLNTLDGIDTKNTEIITIFTTNRIQKINKALLRAGRIDTVIQMTAPDAATAVRLVELCLGKNGNSRLREGENLTEVGETFAGVTPAYIVEACKKASFVARVRTGKAQNAVTAEDLIGAAHAARKHQELVKWLDKRDDKANKSS